MKRTIFYSWQSDLPKETNLRFIEKSIDKALKILKNKHSINLIKDKATRNTAGAIDITKTIFNKISNSSIFLADISIINNSSFSSRKTPNPNVLLELGYASRALGWSNIICLYNEYYGKSNDLPFDLRNHRIMFYNHEKESYDELANKVIQAILKIKEEGKLNNKILDFLKKEIDQEILHLLSHFIRIINDENLNLFKSIEYLLDLNIKEIVNILKNKKILGFYLFKSYEEYEKKFKSFITQALSSKYYQKEILNALIDIYEWFSIYDKMWTEYFNKLFIPLNEKEEKLYIVNGSKIDYRKIFINRYLLLERIDNEKGIVKNFGDFPPGYIDKLLFYYKFNSDFLQMYAEILYELIKRINFWLEITNNEIIVDLIKNFKIKKY